MKSMTGYANLSQSFDWGKIHWEIRSVNQRYLELHFRLPDAFRSIEPPLREACKAQLHRGKVEIGLRYDVDFSEQSIPLDTERLQQLQQTICRVQQALPEATQLNPLELLNWPGVVSTQTLDTERLAPGLVKSFQAALDKFDQNRAREGVQLAQMIAERSQNMREQIAPIKAMVQQVLTNQQQKLRQRIAELAHEVDEQRLAMEMAIIAQKADVEEELDRLNTHLDEVERVIKIQGPIGRRLDFLMQELNREANTLGSKSSDASITATSVELKVLIEQIREQVQNIE